MKGLTKRQAAILEYIADRIRGDEYPPTLQEVADTFEIKSTFAVRRHLAALARKGYIERDTGAFRGIRLTAKVRRETDVPILGRVAAGSPLLAEECLDGHLPIGHLFRNPHELFCLKVVGNSMEGAGILDGDYVVVRQRPDFVDGEIGVAILDEAATVKRLRRVGGKIELKPENRRLKARLVGPEDGEFRYVGKVVGVQRLPEGKPASL
ncbi:MAG TPA: transcriptional repressor LexA [Planctomycetota bacterium]|nr:transcriptional repressor LexA [Planctomycetota bacterium]HRT95316.1 transcriptional repressor LexA [Planctomycetota bacterium]